MVGGERNQVMDFMNSRNMAEDMAFGNISAKKYEIYKHYKESSTNILNDELYYKTHTHQPYQHLCYSKAYQWKTATTKANSIEATKH